jgi:hypothetical protein
MHFYLKSSERQFWLFLPLNDKRSYPYWKFGFFLPLLFLRAFHNHAQVDMYGIGYVCEYLAAVVHAMIDMKGYRGIHHRVRLGLVRYVPT